ncbi:hypothetical protein ID855_03735 [Xenorhabdus sp. ZM]|uniref:hypothetical protein n=1 Tax=Xenorhabdus szentirmaii TaxID=290112 RepID=UPI0019B9C516|nr:hypothetical protein [Xenorhabdus sp. ZM]MBD2803824.1 hypothetical protein [Xenorhabdus sp. ZM]
MHNYIFHKKKSHKKPPNDYHSKLNKKTEMHNSEIEIKYKKPIISPPDVKYDLSEPVTRWILLLYLQANLGLDRTRYIVNKNSQRRSPEKESTRAAADQNLVNNLDKMNQRERQERAGRIAQAIRYASEKNYAGHSNNNTNKSEDIVDTLKNDESISISQINRHHTGNTAKHPILPCTTPELSTNEASFQYLLSDNHLASSSFNVFVQSISQRLYGLVKYSDSTSAFFGGADARPIKSRAYVTLIEFRRRFLLDIDDLLLELYNRHWPSDSLVNPDRVIDYINEIRISLQNYSLLKYYIDGGSVDMFTSWYIREKNPEVKSAIEDLLTHFPTSEDRFLALHEILPMENTEEKENLLSYLIEYNINDLLAGDYPKVGTLADIPPLIKGMYSNQSKSIREKLDNLFNKINSLHLLEITLHPSTMYYSPNKFLEYAAKIWADSYIENNAITTVFNNDNTSWDIDLLDMLKLPHYDIREVKYPHYFSHEAIQAFEKYRKEHLDIKKIIPSVFSSSKNLSEKWVSLYHKFPPSLASILREKNIFNNVPDSSGMFIYSFFLLSISDYLYEIQNQEWRTSSSSVGSDDVQNALQIITTEMAGENSEGNAAWLKFQNEILRRANVQSAYSIYSNGIKSDIESSSNQPKIENNEIQALLNLVQNVEQEAKNGQKNTNIADRVALYNECLSQIEVEINNLKSTETNSVSLQYLQNKHDLILLKIMEQTQFKENFHKASRIKIGKQRGHSLLNHPNKNNIISRIRAMELFLTDNTEAKRRFNVFPSAEDGVLFDLASQIYSGDFGNEIMYQLFEMEIVCFSVESGINPSDRQEALKAYNKSLGAREGVKNEDQNREIGILSFKKLTEFENNQTKFYGQFNEYLDNSLASDAEYMTRSNIHAARLNGVLNEWDMVTNYDDIIWIGLGRRSGQESIIPSGELALVKAKSGKIYAISTINFSSEIKDVTEQFQARFDTMKQTLGQGDVYHRKTQALRYMDVKEFVKQVWGEDVPAGVLDQPAINPDRDGMQFNRWWFVNSAPNDVQPKSKNIQSLLLEMNKNILTRYVDQAKVGFLNLGIWSSFWRSIVPFYSAFERGYYDSNYTVTLSDIVYDAIDLYITIIFMGGGAINRLRKMGKEAFDKAWKKVSPGKVGEAGFKKALAKQFIKEALEIGIPKKIGGIATEVAEFVFPPVALAKSGIKIIRRGGQEIWDNWNKVKPKNKNIPNTDNPTRNKYAFNKEWRQMGVSLDNIAPEDGIYKIKSGNTQTMEEFSYYIKQNDDVYQVRWDKDYHTWRIINPKHPSRFDYAMPIKLNSDNLWEINNVGLLGGGGRHQPPPPPPPPLLQQQLPPVPLRQRPETSSAQKTKPIEFKPKESNKLEFDKLKQKGKELYENSQSKSTVSDSTINDFDNRYITSSTSEASILANVRDLVQGDVDNIKIKANGAEKPAYDIYISRDGENIITSSSYKADDITTKPIFGKPLPYSDIMFFSLKKSGVDLKNLKKSIQASIENKVTQNVIDAIGTPVQRGKLIRVSPTENPDAFYTLLGTDNCKSTSFMLAQHAEEFNGKKITSIEFKGSGYLIMNIG